MATRRKKTVFLERFEGIADGLLRRQEALNIAMLEQYQLILQVWDNRAKFILDPGMYEELERELSELHEKISTLQKRQRVDEERFACLTEQIKAKNEAIRSLA